MQTLTLKALAEAVHSKALPGNALVLPRATADAEIGWLYREPKESEWSGPGAGEYADAGQYEVLSVETAQALGAWRGGGPSPFEDERLCLLVWSASHIAWKAEQDYLSGGA